MLVIQLLLPRFLVVEIVFFFHFMQESQASFLVKSDSITKSDETKLEMEYVVPVGKCNPEDEFLFCNLRGLCSMNFVTNLTNYIIIDSKGTIRILRRHLFSKKLTYLI